MRIWVHILGDGKSRETAWRPNLPPDVPFHVCNGALHDKARGAGALAVTMMLVEIPDDAQAALDAAKIAYKAESDPTVPEKDRRMAEFFTACKGDYSKAAAYFDALPALSTAERKTVGAELIAQALARGMTPAQAEPIIQKHGLADVEIGEVRREAR